MNVVDLRGFRDMLKDWDAVRQHIVQGNIQAGALCLRDQDGAETIFLFGSYKKDSAAASKAGMRVSWEMTKTDDLEEHLLQANQ